MCGIVGAVSHRNVLPILLDGLKRLEYRGYDSAGVALTYEQQFNRVRSVGKVDHLIASLQKKLVLGEIGIAHTRWATHGKPTEVNAHPHVAGDIVLVHNGIIENYAELKVELRQKGIIFDSETDSEVIAHLINQSYQVSQDLLYAVQSILPRLKGAYALLIMDKNVKRLIAVRCGSPLVIGLGENENFVSSDSLSLLPLTNQFIYLEEGDVADITEDKSTLYQQGKIVNRPIVTLNINSDAASKSGYAHYMKKEIAEQPAVIAKTIAAGFDQHGELNIHAFGNKASDILAKVENIRIIACGTSYHAGFIAKYWLEEMTDISCEIEVASEFRYRKTVVRPNTLLIIISQSGETADSLAALRQAKETKNYLASLAICNVASSSLMRETDLAFLTAAGPELGVASTKAFTTQLASLGLLVLNLAKLRKNIILDHVSSLRQLPVLVEAALSCENVILQIAQKLKDKQNALFLGRGTHYPLALEGALKLKEITYIHAEAYPAGELKHGPLALVDENMPVIAIVPNDALLPKIKSNLQEVAARSGELIILTEQGLENEINLPASYILLPQRLSWMSPLVFTAPLQLLAYHTAVLRGTDVDQPRNLAKSVTVE